MHCPTGVPGIGFTSCSHLLQLPALVPLLLRALRAPRLGTARAAILTLKELFLGWAVRAGGRAYGCMPPQTNSKRAHDPPPSCGLSPPPSSYGDALCGLVADDSSPTSCALLALMLKATGSDLNSRRIAADANECLV